MVGGSSNVSLEKLPGWEVGSHGRVFQPPRGKGKNRRNKREFQPCHTAEPSEEGTTGLKLLLRLRQEDTVSETLSQRQKVRWGLGWRSAAERLPSMGQAILALSKEKDKRTKHPGALM